MRPGADQGADPLADPKHRDPRAQEDTWSFGAPWQIGFVPKAQAGDSGGSAKTMVSYLLAVVEAFHAQLLHAAVQLRGKTVNCAAQPAPTTTLNCC